MATRDGDEKSARVVTKVYTPDANTKVTEILLTDPSDRTIRKIANMLTDSMAKAGIKTVNTKTRKRSVGPPAKRGRFSLSPVPFELNPVFAW